jgi:hypothetical protein
MKPRSFSACADPDAEARIAADLEAVGNAAASELSPALVALLLVGGYARGEGGLVERGGALVPYNDYDLVAVVRGRSKPFRRRLAAVGRLWSARLEIDVDISPVGERALKRVPPTLFWLDVALGGARQLIGAPAVLRGLRSIAARQVPLDEAGRLLANRAVGLALSNLEPEERDLRRARHVHKAVLACGDARLLAVARYAPTLERRLAELERLRGAPSVDDVLVDAFADAIRFRARPDCWMPPTDDGDVGQWYIRMRAHIARWHMEFEHWRVGAPIEPRAFVSWRGRIFPTPADIRRAGGLAAAARAAAVGDAPWLPYLGHPRERLARASVALAYGIDDPSCVRAAARLLGADNAAHPEALHERLRRLVVRGG